MKLLGKRVEKDGSGYAVLRPEDDEDMWHLYNIIQEGDEIRATAIRRVQTESTTGSVDSRRVRTNLTLSVEKMTFSAAVASSNPDTSNTTSEASSSQGASLSISGPVIKENQFVKMGAYHTLDLEVNRDVRITKGEWDSIALSRVTEACEEGRGAEVGAIVCGEGTAAVCLLSNHMTVIRQRVEVPVPRKRTGSTTMHDKGLLRFYETLYQSFLRHIPYASLRAIVIASPGFVKDAVYDYIFDQATKTNNKVLLQAKSKFVRVHVSSPHVHSLMEIMKSPEFSSQLAETKFAQEGIALDQFMKKLSSNCAWYGPKDVEAAAERGYIDTLLISDEMFQSKDPTLRRKYVNLVESVRSQGAKVFIFSSMHESGQQLNQMTGVAAILRFPLDIEVVEAEERAAAEDEERRREQESTESSGAGG